MEKTLRMSLLFDFYGALLTIRQRQIFQMYFHEDLSLGEIAKQLDVSRQAIHDILKRAGAILEGFEQKLNLAAKHRDRQQLYNEMLNQVAALRSGQEERLLHLQALEEKILQARNEG